MRPSVASACGALVLAAVVCAQSGCTRLEGARRLSDAERPLEDALVYRGEKAETKWVVNAGKRGNVPALVISTEGKNDSLFVPQAWRDRAGDHFVIWREFFMFWPELLDGRTDAIEFVWLPEAERPIEVYFYPARNYTVVESRGVKRPVMRGEKRTPAAVLKRASTGSAAKS
jgi:hypothetical protein